MRLRTILLGIVILAVTFVGATFAMQVLWPRPRTAGGRRLPTFRRCLRSAAPRPSSRRRRSRSAPSATCSKRRRRATSAASATTWFPNWSPTRKSDGQVNRGPLGVFGKPDAIGVSTRADRHAARDRHNSPRTAAGGLGGALGGVLGQEVGRGVEKLAGRTARPAHRHPRQCRGDLAARSSRRPGGWSPT